MRLSRKQFRLFAGAALAALLFASGFALAGAIEIKGFVLTVSDVDRSVAFLEQALGFKKISERTIVDRNYDHLDGIIGARIRNVTLRLGGETIELEQFLSPAGHPLSADSRSNDAWFQHFAVVVSDMDKAFQHVRAFPITGISSAPQTIPESNKAAAGIMAYKFKDPDGHPLELLYFPPGKGNPKWHHTGGKLFLGVDHSAITVFRSERSKGFYVGLLGLHVTGEGVNSGAAREQLDNALGAVVHITGLRAQSANGPGLEFLEYLAPAGGRPAPVSTRPNDVVATRIILEVDDLRRLAAELQRNNVTFISPDVVSVSHRSFTRGLMVKDPDGHEVLLVAH